jgi:hypothetical protein
MKKVDPRGVLEALGGGEEIRGHQREEGEVQHMSAYPYIEGKIEKDDP